MIGARLSLAIAAGALCAAIAACSADDGDGQGRAGSSALGGSGGGGSGGSGWGDASPGGQGGSSTAGVGGVAGGGGSSQGGSAGAGGGLSCGQVASQMGWAEANCEWNGNSACNGQGIVTYDCDFCCEAGGGSGGSSGSGGSGGSGGGTNGFGYPVGDKSTSPAGGWSIWQVLGHYWSAYGGRHLAQDISLPGGTAAIDAPVYSVADGVVAYAKSNSSAYKNVLLIEHDVGDGTKVCSFYGHINPPTVQAGQSVQRGQQVATIKNWAECVAGGAASNTHLHYVLLNEALCNKAKASGSGSGVCGYDTGGPTSLGRTDTVNEPFYYTSINDACGSHTVQNGFISPTKFIDAHHF